MAEENKAMELHGEESEKKKYISDVLDIDKLIEKYGNKIMLIAGVGSGKSTWVKDVLTQKGNGQKACRKRCCCGKRQW